MNWPADPDEKAYVREVLRDPERAARETTWRISVGKHRLEGDPSSRNIGSIEWGFEEDGPAAVLNAIVAGVIAPENLPLMKKTRLEVGISGINSRVFTGRLLSPAYRGDSGMTGVHAATGGYWLDKIRLMEVLTLANSSPSDVAHDMLSRLPYTGLLDIAKIARPKFNRGEDPEVYNQVTTVGDVMGALTDEAPLDFTDTATDGARVRRPVALRRAHAPRATFVAGRDFDAESLTYEAAEEAEYSAVCAYRQSETKQGGIELLSGLERVPIPGSRAPRDAVYPIEVSDTTASYMSSAREAVYDAVEALSGKLWNVGCQLLYCHPYLERGDIVSIEESGEDDDGAYYRRFKTRILGLKGTLPDGSTLISGPALMTEERSLLAPQPSTKVFRSATQGCPEGLYASSGQEIYSLSYCSIDGTSA